MIKGNGIFIVRWWCIGPLSVMLSSIARRDAKHSCRHNALSGDLAVETLREYVALSTIGIRGSPYLLEQLDIAPRVSLLALRWQTRIGTNFMTISREGHEKPHK